MGKQKSNQQPPVQEVSNNGEQAAEVVNVAETPILPPVVETPVVHPVVETPVVPPVVETPKEETPEERSARRVQKAKAEAAQMLEDSKERGKKEVTTQEPVYRERGN